MTPEFERQRKLEMMKISREKGDSTYDKPPKTVLTRVHNKLSSFSKKIFVFTKKDK
jgi:hypothetical protein